MQIARSEQQTKQLRKQAGTWLKELRGRAGLSQIQLAELLGFKYYTFISQVENGFGGSRPKAWRNGRTRSGSIHHHSRGSFCPTTTPSCIGSFSR